jgi:hypothetical protein
MHSAGRPTTTSHDEVRLTTSDDMASWYIDQHLGMTSGHA